MNNTRYQNLSANHLRRILRRKRNRFCETEKIDWLISKYAKSFIDYYRDLLIILIQASRGHNNKISFEDFYQILTDCHIDVMESALSDQFLDWFLSEPYSSSLLKDDNISRFCSRCHNKLELFCKAKCVISIPFSRNNLENHIEIYKSFRQLHFNRNIYSEEKVQPFIKSAFYIFIFADQNLDDDVIRLLGEMFTELKKCHKSYNMYFENYELKEILSMVINDLL
ncbi:hypothetical protein M9Y10_020071 [Tritrichomonas musculus]|uniref:Uncharacterized protein n=1 Tax=Tritrichomonas musculus TaxID=1915356 RepID=A0ABR2HF84_9EUKA